MNQTNPLIVKSTGGTTAQLLALSNAIYVSQKLNRPFQIIHYPSSTGTFWAFELEALLEPNEYIQTPQIPPTTATSISRGQYISTQSSIKPSFRDVLLKAVQQLGLEQGIRSLLGEVVIRGNRAQLEKVKSSTRSMTAIFVPIINQAVFDELSRRAKLAGFANPFTKPTETSEVVIHYRLGDMRKVPTRVPGMGGHGVVNPLTFKKILEKETIDYSKTKLRLVSDEPEIAKKVLEEIGLKVEAESHPQSVWEDLKIISGAKLFIGSLSQFSSFAGTICANNGGTVYLPSSVYGKGDNRKSSQIEVFKYFDYEYLPEGHWIFREE